LRGTGAGGSNLNTKFIGNDTEAVPMALVALADSVGLILDRTGITKEQDEQYRAACAKTVKAPAPVKGGKTPQEI
jgi:hypothetical protein